VFRGDFSLSMDSKGRMAVPSRYRDRLLDACGGKLVVTISLLEPCLAVYPAPDWQRIEEELHGLPAVDRKAQAIKHLLIGHANECELDGQQRILLPPTLRDFAGLIKQLRVVGQGRKFEIWDDGTWETRRVELLGQVDTLLSEPSEALGELAL